MSRHILTKGAELNEAERAELVARYEAQRMNLETLRETLLDQKRRAVDFITDTRSIQLVPTPDEVPVPLPKVAEVERLTPVRPHVLMVPKDDEGWFDAAGPVAINAHGHGQLRTHLAETTRSNGGQPTFRPEFYRWLIQNEPEQFCLLVNRLLERSSSRRMFRVLLDETRALGTGHVRAYLSDKYRRMDTIEILEHAIVPELESGMSGWQVHECGLTDQRAHLEFILPLYTEAISVGETVAAAVKLTASDVGSGAVDMSFGLHKLECTNLWISTQHSVRKIHVGKRQDELLEVLMSDDTRRLDDEVMWRKMRDAFRAMKSPERFRELVDTAKAANSARAQLTDAVGASELLTENVGLTEAEGKDVERALLTDGNMTLWGLTNALTTVARKAEYERKAELEKAAGKLLTAGPKTWEPYRVAEAQTA
jgi:hypothetical protein